MHPGYCCMILQEASHLQGIAAMPLHTQRQRLQTTLDQVRLKRAEYSAQHCCISTELVKQAILRTDDNSSSTITMSAQVFGRTVYHQVKTMLNRPGQVRCRKRAIHNSH